MNPIVCSLSTSIQTHNVIPPIHTTKNKQSVHSLKSGLWSEKERITLIFRVDLSHERHVSL